MFLKYMMTLYQVSTSLGAAASGKTHDEGDAHVESLGGFDLRCVVHELFGELGDVFELLVLKGL